VQTRFFPYVVGLAGGVHLVNADSASRKQTLKRLRDMSSLQVLWLGHCSGESFMRDVEEAFDSSIVREGGAGYSIAISLE
jgi:metal-dependent hydrolase (beta-lactamase superfamily II)